MSHKEAIGFGKGTGSPKLWQLLGLPTAAPEFARRPLYPGARFASFSSWWF